MRRIKKEVLERLTTYEGFDVNNRLRTGNEALQDFYAFPNSPGAHEREEAIKEIISASVYYNDKPISKKVLDESIEMINTLVSYLEFHHYFYGVTSTPACVFFYENDENRLAMHPIATTTVRWDSFKSLLRKYTPDFVIIHSVHKARGQWFVRWAIKQNMKCIYDNPEYVEIYNPKDEIK